MKTYFSLTCGGWGPRGPRTPTPHPTLLSVNVGYQNIKKLLPLRKYKIPGDSREKVHIARRRKKVLISLLVACNITSATKPQN